MLGFIARIDNGGLGMESIEFIRHLKPDKILAIKIGSMKQYENRFDAQVVEGVPTDDVVKTFLKGLDVVFSVETFYNKNLIKLGREMNVKTVLKINYEWWDGCRPDLIISPTLWNFDKISDPKIFLPFPINRKKLPFKLRTKAKTFLHMAGNMKAGDDRNGTNLFLQAIPLIKNKDIKIKIKSQVPIECNDKRVEVVVKDYDNYWDNWKDDGDVFVSPRRYAGQSLPLNECLSRGVVPIMSNILPQQSFLPSEQLIKIKDTDIINIKTEIEIANIKAKDIANKIDEMANKDITNLSNISNHIAEQWSWDVLLSKYKKILC